MRKAVAAALAVLQLCFAFWLTLHTAARQEENRIRTDLLLQNGIKINRCEIILSNQQQNRIIISSVSIYIDKNSPDNTGRISELCSQNFGIEPNIITE